MTVQVLKDVCLLAPVSSLQLS